MSHVSIIKSTILWIFCVHFIRIVNAFCAIFASLNFPRAHFRSLLPVTKLRTFTRKKKNYIFGGLNAISVEFRIFRFSSLLQKSSVTNSYDNRAHSATNISRLHESHPSPPTLEIRFMLGSVDICFLCRNHRALLSHTHVRSSNRRVKGL